MSMCALVHGPLVYMSYVCLMCNYVETKLQFAESYSAWVSCHLAIFTSVSPTMVTNAIFKFPFPPKLFFSCVYIFVIISYIACYKLLSLILLVLLKLLKPHPSNYNHKLEAK